tara:strand:+ start:284 stop:421 length:138 start_codon:yes stop_codon:yes gene_type:complete
MLRPADASFSAFEFDPEHFSFRFTDGPLDDEHEALLDALVTALYS